MLKIIKKAISGSNNTNNVGTQNVNENSPVQNNNGFTPNSPDSNSYGENQFNQQHPQYNSNHYNITSYSTSGFNSNTVRKSSKTVHNDTGSYSVSEGISNHPQSRSISIAHRNNGYNSTVSCLPHQNMNFSNSQSSPGSIHMPPNLTLSKNSHQFYAQNQNLIQNKKTSNSDIEFLEQQLKLSQQKCQDLESQSKGQNEQIKDLKGTIQSLNDMNHKFYDEIQHLKERNMDQRKQIDSFNKLFQECKQDSERKLAQIRQEFEQSLKREIDLKKMIQQIQENKNQEVNNLKEKLDKIKLIENEQILDIDKKKIEIQNKTEKIEMLESNVTNLENELKSLKENSISEKKNNDTTIENLKIKIDDLNKQIEDDKLNYIEKSNAEKNEQKKHLDELEQKLEQVIKEKAEITCKYAQILDRNKELSDIIKSNEENNQKSLKDSMTQLETYKNKCTNLEKELSDCKEQHGREKEEWKKFQADLQTAVRVANDFMNEAEEKYSRIKEELLNSRESSLILSDIELKKDFKKIEAPINEKTSIKTNGDKKVSIKKPISNDIKSTESKNLNGKNLIEAFEIDSFQTNTDTDDAKLLSFNQINNGNFYQKRSSTTSNDSSPLQASSNLDSLSSLVKQYGVSKRNALMKWCQERLYNYDIEIKNFSSSWNDGLAFCAILHSFLPDKIDFELLKKEKNVKKRLMTAFNLAESIGIEQKLNLNDILNQDRPDWNEIMNYVALIYTHFDKQNQQTVETDYSENKFFSKNFESPKDKSFSSMCLSNT